MTQDIVLKAFLRALLLTFSIICFLVSLWNYTVIVLSFLLVGWLALMTQLDPPEYWDQ